jgi:ubiquitin-protein ligase E3 C
MYLSIHSCFFCSLTLYSFEEAQHNQQLNDSGPPSKCQVALSPRLGVLNNIPFAIPVDVRVSIFRRFVTNDMSRDRSGTTRLSVRRGSIAQDAFDNLAGVDIKAPIEITIINQFGQDEE